MSSPSKGSLGGALGTLRQGLGELFSLRWVRVLAVLAGLVLVARIGAGFLLRTALNRMVEGRDLVCSWENLDLSILSGRGELQFFELRNRDGEGAALLEVEYAVFDLELSSLLVGDLHVRRLEVDGLEARVAREANGTWSFSRHLAEGEDAALQPEPEPTEERAGEPRPIDLRPPLAIEALRVQNARLLVSDQAVSPPIELTLEANAALSGLLTSARPTRFSATLVAAGALDGAYVRGSAQWHATGMDVELEAHAGGLRPAALSAWLEPLDIRPAANVLGATFQADLGLEVLGEARDTLSAQALLHDLALSADGVETLALDALEVQVEALSDAGASVPAITLDGLRARATTTASGALRVAGFELEPQAEPDPRAAGGPMDSLIAALELWTSDSLPRWATLLVREDAEAYPWTLGRFSIRAGEVAFRDQRVTPAADLTIVIEGVEVGTLAHDPLGEAAAVPVEVDLVVPGVARAVRLAGEVDPFAPARSIDLTLEVGGIEMGAVEGYLSSMGLEREMVDGSFRTRLQGAATTAPNGRTEGWIEFDEVALAEDEDLFRLGRVSAKGLLFDPEAWLMRVGEAEVTGLKLAFGRDPSNRIVALGLRTLGFAPDQAAAESRAAAAVPGAQKSEVPPLRLELGRFAWTDSQVTFTDAYQDPPRTFAFDELGFELLGLTIGGEAGGPTPAPATFEARASAPGIFDELLLTGTLRSAPGAVDVRGDLQLACSGLTGTLITPYARAFGIEPNLSDASLSAQVLASVREEDGWRAGLSLVDGSIVDGELEIARLGSLVIEELALADPPSVESIAIDDVLLALSRDAAGELSIGGLRLVQGPPPSVEAPRPAPALEWPALPALAVEEFRLQNARVAWTDASLTPPIETELRLDATASSFSTNGEPAAISARLHVPETLEALELQGALELSSQGLELSTAVVAGGLGMGPLTRMLPAHVRLADGDPTLALDLELSAGPAQEGGMQAHLRLLELRLGDDSEAPALACDAIEVGLARLDPLAARMEFGPLRVSGLELELERDLGGDLHALGLVIGQAPAPSTEPSQDVGPAATEEVARPTGSESDAPVQHVELGQGLLVDLARLRYRDASLGQDARPLELGALLRMPARTVLFDPAPADLAPITWSLEGSVAGLIEGWELSGELAPFAAEPHIEAELDVHGIRTAGLVEIAPRALAGVEGVVEDGELHARLEGNLFVRRGRPTEVGLSRPFGAELELSGLALRDAPGGQVLAGLERALCEFKRIDLETGLVHIDLLEATRPQARVQRSAQGLDVLGLRLQPAADAGTSVEAEPQRTEPVATVAASGTGETRLDTLLVSGIEFRFVDDTSEPPLDLHLTELDAEVKKISSRSSAETRPVQFSVLLGGGKEGLFDELAVSGRVATFPETQGWTTVSLAGLELLPFTGPADQKGIDIEDGALDLDLRLRFRGEEGTTVGSSLTFTDLDVSESAGGPLERLLSLPMALDSALFLLRNSEGEHKFSIGFDMDAGGVSGAQLALTGTRAFAGVLARALAGAPLRLLGALVPGSEEVEEPVEVLTVAFSPASGELAPDAPALEEARKLMASGGRWAAVVRHEFSAEDMRAAGRMANPSEDECLQLARRLRQRKSELLRRMDALGTSARALFAVGAEEAHTAADELRDLNRELASVETGLDQVLEILRSDSPRKRDKRARVAGREIAQRRVDGAVAALLAGLGPFESDRVEARSPRFELAPELPDDGGGRVLIELRRR